MSEDAAALILFLETDMLEDTAKDSYGTIVSASIKFLNRRQDKTERLSYIVPSAITHDSGFTVTVKRWDGIIPVAPCGYDGE